MIAATPYYHIPDYQYGNISIFPYYSLFYITNLCPFVDLDVTAAYLYHQPWIITSKEMGFWDWKMAIQ